MSDKTVDKIGQQPAEVTKPLVETAESLDTPLYAEPLDEAAAESNVVALNAVKTDAVAEVVDLLRLILAEAKAGNITAVGIAIVRRENSTSKARAWDSARPRGNDLVAAVSDLWFDLMDHRAGLYETPAPLSDGHVDNS